MSIAIINNRIRVMDPTDEMYRWAHVNLVLDNPDYYKKLRMNKWLGNTPEYIYLYENVGSELWLPFGTITDFYRQFHDQCTFQIAIAEKRKVRYESNIELYDYQAEAVEVALGKRNGVIVMPCGSGKTQTALEIISRIGGRCLWLTHTYDLLNQSMIRAKSVLNTSARYGKITAGKVDIGEGITFATVQTMSKIDLTQYKSAWDVIIVDECMPGETLIDTPTGPKALKNLHIDDIITSYNRDTKAIENKRVTHIFKNKAHDIVKVKLSNGEEIICTGNHPIFTKDRQWINAERLVNDDYVLRLVWKRSGDGCNAEVYEEQSLKKRVLLLFQRMFNKGRSQKGCVDGRAQKKSIKNNEKHKQSISRSVCGKNENRQSDERCKCAESCFRQIKRNRTSSKNQMRQWSGINCSSTNFNDCTCKNRGSVCRISNTNKNGKRFRLSDLLQSGYSNSRKNGGNRDRWKFSLCDRKTATGSEKRAIFEWIRVESIEVQEQTSDGTFGGLCSDGYVYNIEVEDNNNYFADGILVHNCQHCCGSPTKVTQFYKVVNSLSARYKFGLTATPKRADGLERAMFALLGNVICRITKDRVENTTCPVKVESVETGYIPDYDAVLLGDGTIDYSKLVDDLIHDEDRFKFVLKTIEQLPVNQPVLVLANRIEYLQKLNKHYFGRSNFLSATGNSKSAKEERKRALQALNDGEIDCLFVSYQLAKEGLDIPNLRFVVFATPEKDPTTIEQSTGRVGRKADGKEYGTVVDFVDNFGLYKSWYKKRLSVYKKIDAEVKE